MLDDDSADHGGLIEAIELERTHLGPARAAADLVIDTSDLNPHQLRDRIGAQFKDQASDSSMRITLTSFGFKHGIPLDVDLVFDCRFLPNPHWDPDLRPFSGKDPEIQEYVVDHAAAQRFLADLEQMLGHLLPEYEDEGKSYLTVAFGCTGGRHRSVAIAESVGRILKEGGCQPRVTHRDIDRQFRTQYRFRRRAEARGGGAWRWSRLGRVADRCSYLRRSLGRDRLDR
jgi:UPF0042 nucleotide-binding protein